MKMGKREERLAAIRRIVRAHEVRTQAELGRLMREAGFECTQATISRDIADLGLEKRSRGRGYALPEEAQFERMVVSAESAGNIAVVKTLAGAAQGLALIVDEAAFDGVLGTVAGDDTIMIVGRTPEVAAEVAAYIDAHKRS